MPLCPLCAGESVSAFATVKSRRYFGCPACHLVFLAPEDRLGPEAERALYLTHDNDPTDPRYRAYLDQVAQPLLAVVAPGASGLDYGAGPGPTLSLMLAEQGRPTAVYDPFFSPDSGVLDRQYDFITCTEAAEHFFEPGREFARFDQLLKPGGWLAIMTTTREPDRPFAAWNYIQDLTHVCFFEKRTMVWIAGHHGWTLSVPSKNVALFHKPA
jgi:hypothetical protein